MCVRKPDFDLCSLYCTFFSDTPKVYKCNVCGKDIWLKEKYRMLSKILNLVFVFLAGALFVISSEFESAIKGVITSANTSKVIIASFKIFLLLFFVLLNYIYHRCLLKSDAFEIVVTDTKCE